MSDTPDYVQADYLATLAEEHGIGCPRAVSIRGSGAVDDWITEQYDNIERAAKAAAAEDVEEKVAAEASTVRSAQAEGPVDSWDVKDPWEQLVVDHDEQISGLDARITAVFEDYSMEIDRLKAHMADIEGRLARLEPRMDAQESQGRDQWAGIEANTAARIEAHQKANPPRAKVVPGKPKKKKAKRM